MLKTMHRLCWGLLAISMAAIVEAQPGGWAEALFEKLDHDFGYVARGADTRYRLKLVNKYPDPVHILSAHTLCKCAQARPLQDTIAPGETGYIEITLDTKKFERNRDTTMIVQFDRPQFAEVRIPIKAYIRTDVVLTPGKLEFGSVSPGTTAERKIAIAYSGRPDWAIREVISKNKQIDVQCREINRLGGNCNFELVATLKPGAALGDLTDQLLLVTNDPANPQIPVLIEGRVEADYSVVPGLVVFGSLTPGSRKTVNVVVRGKKPFLIEKIESETTAGTFEVRLPKEPRQNHVLPLTVVAPAEAGEITEEFTMTISGSADPVVFKAHCRVVPSTAARPQP